ncbi:hypothetical protein AB0L04_33040 [Streptomyces glaucescens]|uniref:hypothetical protein n=1 Tax=Streptomyces glaucescens TaxID=1907 RepID=UPI00344BB76E
MVPQRGLQLGGSDWDHAIYAGRGAGGVAVFDATTGTHLTTISDASGASWLTTNPAHLYIRTDTGTQAHKLTKQTTD